MKKYKLSMIDGQVLELINGQYRRCFDATADDAYQQWLAEGNIPDPADPPPPIRKTIQKDELMKRITDAGKFAEADAALQSDRQAYWRFLNSNVGDNSVYCDDAQLRGFITAIGLDPAIILDA